MAFLNNSALSTAAAASAIADAAGASADSEMVTRAGLSYAAAINHFSNFSNWEWTLTEAPTLVVTAPFSPLVPGGGSNLAGSASGNGKTIDFAVGNVTGFGILPGDFITGPMFATNSAGRVTATAVAGVAPNVTATLGFAEVMNPSLWATAGATAQITANRDEYDIPTDWKQPYSVRMLGAQYTLRPIGRRHYDRSVTSEFTPAGTPLYYDMFTVGTQSKIRLLRPPAQTDRLQIRYYRRLVSSTTPCDIPAQYEAYLIAFAKWHFLLDKADMKERGDEWKQFSMEGLQQMLKETTRQPDEDLMFLPGHYSMNVALGPNSVRPYLDEW
jgi:hypothetical protein